MTKRVFINLPVADLKTATTFYEAIGAERNAQFSDDTASCMVFSDIIHVMLLTHDKFRQFTPRPVADARAASEMLLCLSVEVREDVDSTAERAASAGGKADIRPPQDYGFMFGRSIEDPDGHILEIMWMDSAAAAEAMSS
jgi:uncharacterized protein